MTKKLRILRIITRLNVGGPSLQAIDLSCDVPQWETRLISGQLKDDEQSMVPYINGRTIDHKTLDYLVNPISPLKDLKCIQELKKEILEFQPDIVHTHHAKAGIVGRIAASLCQTPVVIHTFHGNVFRGHFSKLKSSMIVSIEKRLSLLANALIALSARQKNDLCDIYKVTENDRVHIIPLGFHLESFLYFSGDKNEIRKELNLPVDAFLCGIVGRLTHVKNHQFFLKSLAKMSERWHSVIVGDGELEQTLKDQVKALGIDHRVHFRPTQSTTNRVYRALDVLAITSHSEGTPATMIEAMACKTPVVAARVGGIPDLAGKHERALLYTPQDSFDFTQKIYQTLKNQERTCKRVSKAQKYVEKKHNFNSLVSGLDKLYRRFLR